jgi:hypothetical protein
MALRAIPLFFKSAAGPPKTRLVELPSDGRAQLAAVLQRLAGTATSTAVARLAAHGSSSGSSGAEEDDSFALCVSLRCRLGERIAAADVSLSFLGVTRLDEQHAECVVAHCPGLPGCFPIKLPELERFQHRLTFDANDATDDMGEADPSLERVVAEAALSGLGRDGHGGGVLASMLFDARKHAVMLTGMTRLLTASAAVLDGAALRPSYGFPYYCAASPNTASSRVAAASGSSSRARASHAGGMPQGLLPADKQYFDVSDRLCGCFHPVGRHGTKLLTPFGIATCVGVAAQVEGLGGGPAMCWHPAGEVSARFAPILHGCRGVVVGQMPLEYNGPSSASLLNLNEDMHKYLNPTLRLPAVLSSSTASAQRGSAAAVEEVELDRTKWLNDGLFGAVPGERLLGMEAAGVGYNARRGMLDVFFVEPRSGVAVPSFELV